MAAAVTSRSERGPLLLKYFVLAFSFTWAFWWLAVLEERGLIGFLLSAVFLGAFGPGLATRAARQGGERGARSTVVRRERVTTGRRC